ncbi:tetraacyldisaccharide 4'-kinase [Candidatus Obscuribacterales bacterium]|nr:tetraacyldisaccharide 4'-kinase [Candidatus Obscuribacterales bacterium]
MAEDLYSKIIANPVAKTLLLPPSFVYGGIGFVRMKAYAEGLMTRVRPRVPVISVGNLSVGGTGKTPVTIDITRRLTADGKKIAILSRGYKRKSTDEYTVVSNGEQILSSCAEAGDEPFMMAQALPQTVVISGKDRSSTSAIASDTFNCDLIVLDDGFQHLKLRRDFDVVLLDYSETLDDALVPAGRLREPFSALGRATHIVISKVPPYPDPQRMRRFQELAEKYAPRAQVSMCRFRPASLRRMDGRDDMSFSQISGQKVVALCGIARPSAFADSLSQLGVEVVSLHAFPDHHWFSEGELNNLKSVLQKSGATHIVTTEKDLVRLDLPVELKEKVVALAMETEWIGSPPEFKFPVISTGNE